MVVVVAAAAAAAAAGGVQSTNIMNYMLFRVFRSRGTDSCSSPCLRYGDLF